MLRRVLVATFFLAILTTLPVISQTPWSGVHGNEWLSGKYGQSWLKIRVSQKGIYKVMLPASFQNKSGQLHLYHRGIEVALISTGSVEIEFYGVPNDGSSDALLYRPYTGTRSNPYYSWFSDESAYFLTFSPESPSKLAKKQENIVLSGNSETYHLQSDLKLFTDEYTHDETKNVQYFSLDQSYYDNTKSMSSKYYWKRTSATDTITKGDPKFPFPFRIKNLVQDASKKPIIDVMFNGRTFTSNQIQVSIGKNSSNLRSYNGLVEFSNFLPYNKQFVIDEQTDLSIADKSGERSGHLQLESVKITDLTSTTGVFSVNYIRLIYPQSFDMSGEVSKTFNLIPTNNVNSRVSIANAPLSARAYDITDTENPILIDGIPNGTTLDIMVARKAGKELNLLITSEVKNLATDKVTAVSFVQYNPVDNDYLIVSSESLFNAGEKYAQYRRSLAGGNFRTLNVSITDIYNQFNYGEPSPVAIRRFADYMISNAPREKHNLLLIGPSTTFPSKMNRELKDEVPTIGYPGSDVLLVEGLVRGYAEIPSIPVGRISATSLVQVESYLDKVKYYEANKNVFEWKKRIIHLNGGKSASEISQFKASLEHLSPVIKTGFLGGEIFQFVKQSTIEVEKVDISSVVNTGAGMISYLGHGSPSVTDLDYGYVTDLSRGYANAGKYPLLYFNGCGVGNIFSGRHNPSPTSSDRIPISSDWTAADGKGAIAVIANTYYSFASTSSRYLEELYDILFGKKASNSLSIGQVQQLAAINVFKTGLGDYDVANVHQSLLQGDPAVKLFTVDFPDYSLESGNSIYLKSESPSKTIEESKFVRLGVIISNRGRFMTGQKVPVRLTYTFKGGTSQVKDTLINAIANRDTLFSTVSNNQPVSKILVQIDPAHSVVEAATDNNRRELLVDWEIAKATNLYPAGIIKDIMPPIIEVSLDGFPLRNDIKLIPQSSLSVKLTDDNFIRSDSSSLDIFVRPCLTDDCDFRRVSYSTNLVKIISADDYSIEVAVDTKVMGAGSWELMITGRDVSGNTTLQPYRVAVHSVEALKPELSVWPNPGSEYVCFDVNYFPSDFISGKLRIYDLLGRIVEDMDLNKVSKWFWLPKVNNGVYIYKLNLISTSGEQKFQGKVVISR